ncbi:hypothetical protein [Pseudomonas sp. GL-B-16]|uniref:hypothetical protein n=1 Tax=Pseudomonas sp. GL-B-16 TaxID=2832373 RepID=UPI001CBA94DE|nr:hypothetical protein [Pseudomonas sp. GL-B-16]
MDSNALQNAVITLSCHNTPGGNHILTVPFMYNQTTSDGIGHASSHKVQFNINKAAAAGTIFVDEHNDGVCIATITSNHIIKSGGMVFAPEGSSTDDNSSNPSDINQSVKVTWVPTSNKEITFSVHRVGSLKGNVTLIFFVTYEAAI